jgi:hypothetical protein
MVLDHTVLGSCIHVLYFQHRFFFALAPPAPPAMSTTEFGTAIAYQLHVLPRPPAAEPAHQQPPRELLVAVSFFCVLLFPFAAFEPNTKSTLVTFCG